MICHTNFMKGKLVVLFVAMILVAISFNNSFCFAFALNQVEIYFIYDTDGNKISETNYVEVGDIIITKDLKEYEIFKIDQENLNAYATFNGNYIKPKIKNNKEENLNLSKNLSKSVGLYLTHNDESYIPSDGVSSVYGEGGIHDVARELASCFNSLGYKVYLDETLHLPHDNKAYARSGITAQSLLENSPDALFDIHRDGVSRSVYVENVDGIERCKVRIVVGQANPKKDANLQFAMYLLSVSEEYCPWLFLDIYYAKGDYNQELTSKGLLFEMGTYLAEKELVLKSVPELANVIDKTLFSTVVNDDNSLEINPPSNTNNDNLVNNILNNNTVTHNFNSRYIINVIVFACLFIAIMIGIAIYSIVRNKKRQKKK